MDAAHEIENPERDLATQFIQLTDKSLFLTGRAGTGKTTFLRWVVDNVKKRMAVVAPTGVAAINARGMTIQVRMHRYATRRTPYTTLDGAARSSVQISVRTGVRSYEALTC